MPGRGHTSHIRQTDNRGGLFFNLFESRYENGQQQRNDGNDDQQLNNVKAFLLRITVSPESS